jgi:hypothetical protein
VASQHSLSALHHGGSCLQLRHPTHAAHATLPAALSKVPDKWRLPTPSPWLLRGSLVQRALLLLLLLVTCCTGWRPCRLLLIFHA